MNLLQNHGRAFRSKRHAPARSCNRRKDRRFHPWRDFDLETRLLLSTFWPVNIAPIANSDFELFYARGNQDFGGVPFDIPVTGKNAWDTQDQAYPGPNPREVTIPVGRAGVTAVHTLMNTAWGAFGPNSYTSLEFFGSAGAYFRKDFIGGIDIRSYGSDRRYPEYAQTINGTTTVNVFTSPIPGRPGENWWLDKQKIDLPGEFRTQTLDTIHVSDTGANYFHRAFLYGVTVDVNATDLAANSLAWNTAQGGVDLHYTVNNAQLPQDTSAALYWASGMTEDTILEPAATPIPIPKTTPVGEV